jgi:hypothetical protein
MTKNFFKKIWKIIKISIALILTGIAGIISILILRDKKADKKKQKIITKNDKILNKINKEIEKDEKKIHNSTSIYNRLVTGKYRRK